MSSPTRRSVARRFLASFTALALLLGAAVTTVGAAPPTPVTIDLPNGFQPEGIESHGHWLYAGSLANGAIYRADALTGEGQLLVPGVAGRVAVGLHIDDQGRLWVAGGPTGTIRVYSARTGEPLATYTFAGTGFLNDLDIVDNVVYATDSLNPQFAVVPLGQGGSLLDPSAATLMPVDITYQAGFNVNGIVAAGHWLIVVQSNTGQLYRVDPDTGDATEIDTGGYSVTAGDGLELRDHTLYAVRNQLNLVAVLRLSSDFLSASLVGEITADDPDDLSVPTTATTSLGALWVVNARFGVIPTPDTEYWITRLPRRP